ncbi:J domain-containing protein [Paenarthrobacter sp. PH39-S1]|uniref:J domain-containing protein n=1 Tax=Paenarthrobacter sp. PH39-S1 TaxID=3046204 RepID=UPI0024BACAA2|nr:J domain-containing protein [Paenarthrobacter sp. PH39-S1]MDJ0357878.1 J domain-containing protein [Paenarthrobacter sp. PH39-S1]
MSGLPDFYAVLHIGPEVTAGEVGRAYGSLLRRYHPDTRPLPATPADAAIEGKALQEIMAAHAVLADPVQRALYDHGRRVTGAARGRSSGARPARAGAAAGQPQIIVGPLRWERPGGLSQ